jgi:hypothetical protein
MPDLTVTAVRDRTLSKIATAVRQQSKPDPVFSLGTRLKTCLSARVKHVVVGFSPNAVHLVILMESAMGFQDVGLG